MRGNGIVRKSFNKYSVEEKCNGEIVHNNFENYNEYACASIARFREGMGFMAAKRYAENKGVKIFNATRGEKPEVFDRMDFDLLFH